MSPVPVPIDLTVAPEPGATSKDSAIDSQAPAVAADGTQAQPAQAAGSDQAVLDALAAAQDRVGTALAATDAPSGQEGLPQDMAAAVAQETVASATSVTTPPASV